MMAGGMGLYGGLNPYYQFQYDTPLYSTYNPYSMYTNYLPMNFYNNLPSLNPLNPFEALNPLNSLFSQPLNPNILNLNQLGNELQLGQNNLLNTVTQVPTNMLENQNIMSVNPLSFENLFKPSLPTLLPHVNQGSTNNVFGAKITRKIPTVDRDIIDIRRGPQTLHCQLFPLDPLCIKNTKD